MELTEAVLCFSLFNTAWVASETPEVLNHSDYERITINKIVPYDRIERGQMVRKVYQPTGQRFIFIGTQLGTVVVYEESPSGLVRLKRPSRIPLNTKQGYYKVALAENFPGAMCMLMDLDLAGPASSRLLISILGDQNWQIPNIGISIQEILAAGANKGGFHLG